MSSKKLIHWSFLLANSGNQDKRPILAKSYSDALREIKKLPEYAKAVKLMSTVPLNLFNGMVPVVMETESSSALSTGAYIKIMRKRKQTSVTLAEGPDFEVGGDIVRYRTVRHTIGRKSTYILQIFVGPNSTGPYSEICKNDCMYISAISRRDASMKRGLFRKFHPVPFGNVIYTSPQRKDISVVLEACSSSVRYGRWSFVSKYRGPDQETTEISFEDPRDAVLFQLTQ